jgi:hypothetical protein
MHEAVQSAVNKARDGDTINIPSGNCSWRSGVFVPDTKGLRLIGAGIGQTVIGGSVSTKITINIAASSSTFTRISGIEFRESGTQIQVYQSTRGGSRSSGRYRIDNCKFTLIRRPADKFSGITAGIILYGNAYGVVDNCTFQASDAFNGVFVFGDTGSRGSVDGGYKDWQEDLALGTAYMHYIEDCIFSFDNYAPGVDIIDGRDGGRVVLRYCTIQNGNWGMHDACVYGKRGNHSWEIYHNTFTTTPSSYWTLTYHRGGTGVIFNNNFRGNNCNARSPLYFNNPLYRSDGPCNCGPWPRCAWAAPCDGTPEKMCERSLMGCRDDGDCGANGPCVQIDGQEDGYGYPCRDQFGTTSPGLTKHPVVAWNNKWCNTGPTCSPTTDAPILIPLHDHNWIKPERDYIDYNTCSDGIDNDGDGQTDMNDTICLTYWDDVKKQKKEYTPCTYPHSLRTAELLPLGPEKLEPK